MSSLIKEVNDMAAVGMPDAREEMARIANYWRENGEGMTEDELTDSIAMDLEMLEYPPEQVEIMIPQILELVRGGS